MSITNTKFYLYLIGYFVSCLLFTHFISTHDHILALVWGGVTLVGILSMIIASQNLDIKFMSYKHLEYAVAFVSYDMNLKQFNSSPLFKEMMGLGDLAVDELTFTLHKQTMTLEEIMLKAYRDPEWCSLPLLEVSAPTKNLYCKLNISCSIRGGASVITAVFTDISDEYVNRSFQQERYDTLSKANNQMTLALNTIATAVWVRDKNMNIVYFNRLYSHIVFGANKAYDPTSLEIDKLAKNTAKTALQENNIKVEDRYIIVEGKRRLYQFTDIPVADKEIVVSTGYDVFSKDEISQELQRSLAAQADLLESTSNACVIFGKDRKLGFYNQAFVQLWNLNEQQLNGSLLYEELLDRLYHAKQLPAQSNYNKYRKEQVNLFTNLTTTHEDFAYLPDGRFLRIIVIPHSAGGLLFSYEDRTDRLALETSYNILIAVQKSTINNLQEGICVFAENGNIELVNQQMLNLWNAADMAVMPKTNIMELLAKAPASLRSKEELIQDKNEVIKVMSSREASSTILNRRNNTVVRRVIVPLPDGATLVSDMDMTDSFRAEHALRERNQALEEADKIKSQFLANVSHELRSPLTSIMGFAQVLMQNYYGDLSTKQREYLQDIIVSTEYLANMISDLIDLTSLEAKYVNLDLVEANLVPMLEVVVMEYHHKLERNKIGCQFISNISRAMIKCDIEQINQMLRKLMTNAAYQAPENSYITVTLDMDAKDYLIKISGASTNLKRRDFFEEQGLGDDNHTISKLGLSVVKAIADMHSGSVVTNTNEAQEVEFIITLPKILMCHYS